MDQHGGDVCILWLIPRLADWQRENPAIELAISTTTWPVDLAVEDFDCAIRHGLGGWEGLTATLLFRETLLPVAHPELADLSGGSTAIRARSRFRDWNRWWRATGRAGVPPERSMVVETRAQAMNAALAGAGIAVMDAACAAQHLASGRLRAVSAAVPLSEGYYLVTNDAKKPRSEMIRRLQAWLIMKARTSNNGLTQRLNE